MSVYRHPSSLFVAGFIGSPAMNFLAAEIAADGAAAALAGGVRLPLPGSGLQRLAGQQVILGLRPEHMRSAQGDEAGFRAQIQLVVTLGADTIAHGILVGNGDALTVRLPGGAQIGRVSRGRKGVLYT